MGRRTGLGGAAEGALPTLTAGDGGGKGAAALGQWRSRDVGAVVKVGEEGLEEALGQGAVARRVAAFEVADDGGEGGEREAGISDQYGEGLGRGSGAFVGLGMGPFQCSGRVIGFPGPVRPSISLRTNGGMGG